SDRGGLLAELQAVALNRPSASVERGTVTTGTPGPETGDDQALASAWVSGAEIDWRSRWSREPGRVSLPTFPLAKTRHWFANASHNGSPSAGPARPAPGSRAAEVVRAHLGELLGLAPAAIPGDRSFQGLGLDSIFAMDLAERLSEVYRREIEAAVLYDHDTIDSLGAFLETAPA